MVKGSISGYNMAARQGKDAAIRYCQQWMLEVTQAGAALSADYVNKRLTMPQYNIKRDALNKATADLNSCIQSINRQFGG